MSTRITTPSWVAWKVAGLASQTLVPLHRYACSPCSSHRRGLTELQGILYLSSPFTFALLSRYPHLRRWSGPLGLLITVVGFLSSSFANSIGGLVATQGVIAAIGGGLLYCPVTLYMDEWWVRRKGLAYGVMLASKALSGVIIPFVMDALLHRFGFRITMRAWSVAIVGLCFHFTCTISRYKH